MDTRIDIDRLLAERAPAPPDVPRLVVSNPAPEEVGAPVPGAMAVLAMTAFLVSCVLAVAKAFGVEIGILVVLAPMWGSALAVALAAAVTAAVAWAGRSA